MANRWARSATEFRFDRFSSSLLWIGAANGGSSPALAAFDDFRISDRVRFPAEILADYVADLNDFDPVLNGATVNLAENSADGTTVTTLTATDADVTKTLRYSITGGNGLGIFEINSSTGVITVADKTNLNRESVASVSLTVQVSDNGPGTARSASTNVTINITDVNEFSPTVSGAPFSVAENSANGALVGTASGSDSDATNGTLNYSITGGNGLGIFAINASTGTISVADKTNLDREAISSVTLTVQVSDNGPGTARTASTNVTISITDVNEFSPTVSGGPFTVAENSANGTPVGTVSGSDSDATNGTLSYSITGGNSLGLFAINPSTGAITVANQTNLDREAISSVTLTVQISDHGPNSARTGSANVTINVTPVNEFIPTITSASQITVVDEVTNVMTVTATDLDRPDQPLSFSIVSGVDQSLFGITSGGDLAFLSSPNFDLPSDADGDNIYVVQVQVSDGSLTSTQTIEVTVTPQPKPDVVLSSVSSNGTTA